MLPTDIDLRIFGTFPYIEFYEGKDGNDVETVSTMKLWPRYDGANTFLFTYDTYLSY